MKTELINKLNNPKQITGFLLWNRGKPIEIETDDSTAIQEMPGSIEIWQTLSGGRIIRVGRWLKKGITHYVINNTFISKY